MLICLHYRYSHKRVDNSLVLRSEPECDRFLCPQPCSRWQGKKTCPLPPCLERCKQQVGQQPFQEFPYWQAALCRLSVPFRERYTATAKSPQEICVENTEQNQQNMSSANPKALKGLFEEEAAKPISHYGKKPRTACAFKQPIHFHKRSVYCSWHLCLVGIVLCLFKLNMREISLNSLIPISKVPRACQT